MDETTDVKPLKETALRPKEEQLESTKPTLYRFTGAYPQTYMDRSLLVEPGQTYEWPDGAPADGRWIEEK